MKKLCVLILAIAVTKGTEIIIEDDVGIDASKIEPWTWKCTENGCLKTARSDGERAIGAAVCKAVCPAAGVLWPRPRLSKLSFTLFPIDPFQVSFANGYDLKDESEGNEMIRGAFELFSKRIKKLDINGSGSGRGFDVFLTIDNPKKFRYVQGINESYSLTVKSGEDGKLIGHIRSENALGARHGLETLGQLIVLDPLTGNLLVPSDVEISDGPVYTHRGISLDTARNFISPAAIKRTLDGMAASKLNTFHWHITDTQSFPFESRTYPNLTHYGAYAKNKIYTENDIIDIVEYATVRGIRVVPEFDAPAHVGEGWQWANEAVVCLAAEPWQEYCVEPPCGQLDPTQELTYKIIKGIYSDMARLFKSDHFHMGGDEVNINCWRSVERIIKNMKAMGLKPDNEGFHELWSKFQERVRSIASDEFGTSVKPLLWTSSLTEGEHLTKFLNSSDYIIQIWTKKNDSAVAHLVNNGFQVIFSNYDALYFDCGFGAWVGAGNNWCSPYIPWQTVYENDPKKILSSLGVKEELHHLALGSEAALWTEQADDASIDNRFWPRASAMGEALWSGGGSWKKAEHRLLYHRETLLQRGIQADTMQPQWCFENQGLCYL